MKTIGKDVLNILPNVNERRQIPFNAFLRFLLIGFKTGASFITSLFNGNFSCKYDVADIKLFHLYVTDQVQVAVI